MKTSRPLVLAASLACAGAIAHVSVAPPVAEAGQPVQAAFRVGHGCDKSPTTALAVQVPVGFAGATPQPRAGWTAESRG